MENDSEETVVVALVSGFLLILNEYNQKKSGNNSDRKTFHTAALSHPNNSSTYIVKQRLRSTEGLQPGHGYDGLWVFFV